MGSIPARAIVDVIPNVLSAGGQALDLSGLVLTTSSRVPIGDVISLPSKEAVQDYFGPSSDEAAGAAVYFGGFENSNVKPAAILFAQYPVSSVAAYLRGASLATMTLAELQALSGSLTLVVNGVSTTSAAIDLSLATSFSDAAAIIQSAFASPQFTATFDSIASAFKFTTNTTGASATMSYGSGTLATGLKLTAALGAVVSQGAAATTPVVAMNAIAAKTTNWASFMTMFDPDAPASNTNRLAFALWTAQQNNRYVYVVADSDAVPTQSVSAPTSFGNIVKTLAYSGVAPVWQDEERYHDWFVCGAIASIDFSQLNGNTDLAFKSQAGLTPSVDDETVAENLLANGYNFYGKYATANEDFIWFYNGQICGDYSTIRAYVNQIWLTNQLQLALMVLLANIKALPYNVRGYSQIEAACLDPINQALNFGAIQPGITLSSSQAAQVNAAAGLVVSTTLQNRGWYLQVRDASPQVRQAGGTPPITFWYTDGGSIRKLSLASINVQ